MRAKLGFSLALLFLVPLACDGGGGPGVGLAGVWSGSYTHPATPGILEVTIDEAVDVLSGSFVLRFGSAGGGVNQFGGSITGTRSGSAVSFTIVASTFSWVFSGQVSGSRLAGTWASASSAGLNGTFSLERE